MSGESTAVRLAPMGDEGFSDWSARSVRGFAAQQVAAGVNRDPEATAYARRQLAELLPRGPASPGHCLWTVHDGAGAPIGHAWLQLRRRPGGDVTGYLLDIEVAAPRRGQGLGRATMLAVEQEARRRHAVALDLNVFGHNGPARALYSGLGYTVVEATLTLAVFQPPARETASRGVEVALRDMTESDLAAIRPSLAAEHGADLDRLLPSGAATSGHRLWTAHAGPVTAGAVWLQLQLRSDGLHALVRHLHADGGLSRSGHGPALLRAVHRVTHEMGTRTLTLSLPGSATGPRALVAEQGFVLVAQTLTKPL